MNARLLGLDYAVEFHRGRFWDLLATPCPGTSQVARILCTFHRIQPPLRQGGDFPSLPPEVREHEPRISLVAGPSGTETHHRLMGQAPLWLAPGGLLLMEGGEEQVEGLAREAAGFGFTVAEVHADLNGRPRIVEMRRG